MNKSLIKILLVEDNPGDALLLKETLERVRQHRLRLGHGGNGLADIGKSQRHDHAIDEDLQLLQLPRRRFRRSVPKKAFAVSSSRPTSSIRAIGPTGNPHRVITLSSVSIGTPSSSINPASLR